METHINYKGYGITYYSVFGMVEITGSYGSISKIFSVSEMQGIKLAKEKNRHLRLRIMTTTDGSLILLSAGILNDRPFALIQSRKSSMVKQGYKKE